MADRPLILPGWAVRAVLREIEAPGTGKSQHRVVLKNLTRDRDGVRWHLGTRYHGVFFACDDDVRSDAVNYSRYLPFAAGDRLWVRETWRCEGRYDDFAPREIRPTAPVYFAADPDPRDSEPGCAGRLRPSLHMPRWASRLTLLVTSVRVHRVQDITEEDARAEGYPLTWDEKPYDPPPPEVDFWQGYGCASMCLHWNQRHGLGAWARNDWVVAMTFRPIPRNIGAAPC